jgi:hypothetical protein
MDPFRSARALALAVASFPCLAQPAPGAWQSLTDRSGQCQVQVPPGWNLKPGVLPSAQSQAGDAQVKLEPVLSKVHVDYGERRDRLMKSWSRSAGFTVLQQDASRTVLRFTNGTRVHWSVLTSGPVVCEATVSARDAKDPLPPRIAATLRAVRP